MEILSEKTDLTSFWIDLASADHALLLLDFDGTISPFVVDPQEAKPYPGVLALLDEIALSTGTRLVIVSGREVASLERCLGMAPVPELWGCHGWQRRLPDRDVLQVELPAEAEILLREAEWLVQQAGYSNRLERKPVSVALHWRGMSVQQKEQLQPLIKQWQRLGVSSGLQLHDFDGGIELRCAGVDKGTAVRQLLKETDRSVSIAYLGDDLTDEDAFRALADRGLKVLVRAQKRETAADLWLQPPHELLWFLRKWLEERGGDCGQSG